MKTTLVNFIGYGDWGSRFAQKVHEEGYVIQNLVTNREDISVSYNNLLRRDEISKVDWSLPTFIATGPLYHHEILEYSKERVFVEKPYLLSWQKNKQLVHAPYVNYHWYNSLKLKMIKVFLGYNWKNLHIDFFTTTRVDRGFSVLEDFLPHVVSMIRFLNPNHLEQYKIIKISDDVYKIDFHFISNKIFFTFGISEKRYVKFKTEEVLIETKTPKTLVVDGFEYSVERDQLADSIHRYYNYYTNGTCERIFYDNEVSEFSLKLLKESQCF